MGATVFNGGAGSLVGANALVTEGKEFPEFSLIVGSRPRDPHARRSRRGAAQGDGGALRRQLAALQRG